MPVTETTNRELLLAAQLVARPELAPALFPPSVTGTAFDLRRVKNSCARATINLIVTYGAAYANPAAIEAAFEDAGIEVDGEDFLVMCQLVPSPKEVTVEGLLTLKEDIEQHNRVKDLRVALLGGVEHLRTDDPDETVSEIEQAIREFRQGAISRDPSTLGILDDMEQGELNIRWKIGCSYLDDQVQGVGPNGEFTTGVAGQGETLMIVAKYGVGKSRWALNIANALLDQPGSNISMLVGEDSRASYGAKLMGVRFRLEKWRIEQARRNRQLYLDTYGADELRRVDEATDWFVGISKRFRIYDRRGKVNIYKFPSAMGLLEEDVALYGPTHIFIDYVQIWKGDTPTLESYAQDLLAFGGRHNLGLILLSQIPGEAQKYGVTPGVLPTKGSTEWPQIAHFGYFLEQDPLVGQKEVRITQVKGRDAGQDLVFAHFDVVTGQVTDYAGSPTWMGVEDQKEDGGPRRRRSS